MGNGEGTEKKLEVAEMRMLRWMCRVMKLDKMRNERVRGQRKWGNRKESPGKKVEVVWDYEHVMRREEHYIGR